MRDISVDYIWEKVMVAVGCLCSGTGSFEERFYNAYNDALIRLRVGEPPPKLAEDLRCVLEMCDRHHVPDAPKMSPVPDTDRRKLVEKLIHLLIETSRMTAA
jgi:hypothetical protein